MRIRMSHAPLEIFVVLRSHYTYFLSLLKSSCDLFACRCTLFINVNANMEFWTFLYLNRFHTVDVCNSSVFVWLFNSYRFRGTIVIHCDSVPIGFARTLLHKIHLKKTALPLNCALVLVAFSDVSSESIKCLVLL